MTTYRERLWPALWIPWALLLVIPASLLVLEPVSWLAGAVTGAVLYVGSIALWIASSQPIEVVDGELCAGRARISLTFLGEAEAIEGHEAFLARGQNLNPRAWLLIRGGVADVVRVPVMDPDDPTPYWLLSTRHAKKLAAAINSSRRPASEHPAE